MGLTEHQAKQLHAARIHSSQRESQVRAALGVKGGLKYLLPQFTITAPEGEDSKKFRRHFESLDWEMPCDECFFIHKTSLYQGRLLCQNCIGSAKYVSGR